MEDNVLGQGLFVGLLETIFPGLTYLPYFAVFAFMVKFIFESWSEVITPRFISIVEVSAHDETYNYLMYWASQHNLSQNNYRLHASSSLTNESFQWSYEGEPKEDVNDDDNDDDNDPIARQISESRSMTSLYNAKPVYWTPAFGTHFFRYENRILSFSRYLEGGNYTSAPRQPEKLAISCLGRDATVLKRLVYNARVDFLEKQKGKTSIFRATKFDAEDDMIWTRCMAKATRPMSTIILEEHLKHALIKDLRRYLEPQTKHWYANRGIPYRRGYLFAGPPGTGKTSLTLAAAGLLGLDIYMVNLNSPRLNEDSLASLFQKLPETCLVLLEDIDATELAQKRSAETASMGLGKRKKRNVERLSLSGLLNVIDGVGAQEGRVLVMTSNHTENIDPALLRPGRIDHTINFKLATSEGAEKLFIQMYDAPDLTFQGPETEKRATDNSILSKALKFKKKIPNLALSPASIQGFLLTYQEDPDGAIHAASSWVNENLQQKGAAKVSGEVMESENARGSENAWETENDSSGNDTDS
ncbi:hypothetical protein F53441_1557 [Fusarium austroafricanum]|uniref:AAA+ ATPase domain-containing protein n=1 Tax=Fusarium austroafricanum TaxID=2364996 RepID=A0A8H4KV24_9HYPO|nr:hypothetical protein F53441_1557 [Fusarium austroafricanum]